MIRLMNQTSLRDTIEKSYKRSSRYKKFTNEEDRALDLSDLLDTTRKVHEWTTELALRWMDIGPLSPAAPVPPASPSPPAPGWTSKQHASKWMNNSPLPSPPPSAKKIKVEEEEEVTFKDLKEFSSLLKMADPNHILGDCKLIEWLGRAALPIFDAKLIEDGPDMAPRACPVFRQNTPRISPASFAGAHRLMMATTTMLSELCLPVHVSLPGPREISMTQVPLSIELLKDLRDGFRSIQETRATQLTTEIALHETMAAKKKAEADNETNLFNIQLHMDEYQKHKDMANQASLKSDLFRQKTIEYGTMLGRIWKETWVVELKDYEKGLVEYRDAFKQHCLDVQEYRREEKRSNEESKWRATLIKKARDQIGFHLTRYFNVDQWHQGPHIKVMGIKEEEPPVTGNLATAQMLVQSRPPIPPVANPSNQTPEMRDHVAMAEATKLLAEAQAEVREGLLEEIGNNQGELKTMAHELGDLLMQRAAVGTNHAQLDKEIAELKTAMSIRIQVIKELGRSATDGQHLEGILSTSSESDDELEHLFKLFGMSQKVTDALDRTANNKADRDLRREQFDFQQYQFKIQQDAKEKQEIRQALESSAKATRNLQDEISVIQENLSKLENDTSNTLVNNFIDKVKPPTLGVFTRELEESVFQLIDDHCRRDVPSLSKKELDRLEQLILREKLLHSEACNRLAQTWNKWTMDLTIKVDNLADTPFGTFANLGNELAKIDNARDQAIHAFESTTKLIDKARVQLNKQDDELDSQEVVKKADKLIKDATLELEKFHKRATDITFTAQKVVNRLDTILSIETIEPAAIRKVQSLKTQALRVIQTMETILVTCTFDEISSKLQPARDIVGVFKTVVTVALHPGETARDLLEMFRRAMASIQLLVTPQPDFTPFVKDAEKCIGDWTKLVPLVVIADNRANQLFKRVVFSVWRSSPTLLRSMPNQRTTAVDVEQVLADMKSKMETSFGSVFKYNTNEKELRLRKRILQLYCFMVSALKRALDPVIEGLSIAKSTMEMLRLNPGEANFNGVLTLVLNCTVRASVCHKAVDYQTQFIRNMQILVPGVDLYLDPAIDFVFDPSKLHTAINRVFFTGSRSILFMKERLPTSVVLNEIERVLTEAQRCTNYDMVFRLMQSLTKPVGSRVGPWVKSVCLFTDDALLGGGGDNDPFAQAWKQVCQGTITETMSVLSDSTPPNLVNSDKLPVIAYKGTEPTISTVEVDPSLYGVPSTVPGPDQDTTPWIYRRRFVCFGTYDSASRRILCGPKSSIACPSETKNLVARYVIALPGPRLDKQDNSMMDIYLERADNQQYLVAFNGYEGKKDKAECAVFALC